MAEYDFINITKLMHCGVYLLLRKGEVVYVGKSKQPLMRIHTHVRNRGRALSQGEYGKACGPAFKGKGIGFDEIRALLKQMVVISSLPPQDDSFQRFIPRRL